VRSLNELVDVDSAWPLGTKWLSQAAHPVEILQTTREASEAALLAVQITAGSPMGSVILNSAGILVDSGWLRFLAGGSHPKMLRSLPNWNANRAQGYCIFADDAVGGYFAINGGALGTAVGEVFYFAPDALEWVSLGAGYSDFFQWSLTDSLREFYADLRWPGWRSEVELISGDQILNFYPFLWATGEPLKQRSRRLVPATEYFDLQRDILHQMRP
jgi:hypothetical protein